MDAIPDAIPGKYGSWKAPISAFLTQWGLPVEVLTFIIVGD